MSDLQSILSQLHDRQDFSILFAEDEPMIQKPMAMIMRRICNDVLVVNNGQEAWDTYQQRAFSIVITDLQMPHMDGAELVKHIRSVNPTQIIAVVTAYRDGEEIERAKEYGVDHIILKPLSLPMFMEMLEGVINQTA